MTLSRLAFLAPISHGRERTAGKRVNEMKTMVRGLLGLGAALLALPGVAWTAEAAMKACSCCCPLCCG